MQNWWLNFCFYSPVVCATRCGLLLGLTVIVSACSREVPPKEATGSSATFVRHNFAYVEGTAYAYAIHQGEQPGEPEFIIVRYIGVHNGEQTLITTHQLERSRFGTVYSCRESCQIVKTRTCFAGLPGDDIFGPQLGDAELMNVKSGSVLQAIIADMKAGQLARDVLPFEAKGENRYLCRHL